MKIFKNIFRRKEKPDPQALKIDGVGEAPLTPEPDDAELAAQALLEMMAANHGDWLADTKRKAKDQVPVPMISPDTPHDAAYYNALAARIRQAHDAARLRTMRFVAFCEQELKKADLPLEGPGSLGLLNVELMKRIDTIERVGGELKRRWQHCVAEVTVRLMKATAHTESRNDGTTDNTDLTDGLSQPFTMNH